MFFQSALKMEDKFSNIFEYPYALLKLTALHPSTSKRIRLAAFVFYVIAYCILFTSTIAQFFYVGKNIYLIIENIEAFGLFIQTSGKLLTCAMTRNVLRSLMEDKELFWRLEQCPEHIKLTVQNMLTNTLRVQKLFSMLLFISLISCEIAPFFSGQFPLGVWSIEEHDSLYKMVLGVQEVLIPILVAHAVAYDGMFLSFCVLLIIQFKMLKNSISNLKADSLKSKKEMRDYTEKLVTYVDYHVYLIKFLIKMKNMYSTTMLIEYLSLVLVCCAQMYILFESKDIEQLNRHFFIMISVLLQLAFYCILADYITYEASTVGYGIYESDWYFYRIPVTNKMIPFIIQRSQKELIFTAGGLYDMNSETLLKVLKLAWSICMVMRALKK